MTNKKKTLNHDVTDGRVIGKGYAVSGGIHAGRDVIMGDQYNYVGNLLKMPGYDSPPDLEQLRNDYLKHLRSTYRALDFKGIPQLDSFSRELLLEDVYIPLVARPEMPSGETWERRLAGREIDQENFTEDALPTLIKGETAPSRVEEALGKQNQIVVLGDPGSGKTTLLKHTALCLAAEPNAPLPILLPLNAYASALSQGDCNLQEYLPRYYAGLSHGVSGLAPLFASALEQGSAVILVDGLDEVQRDRTNLVHKVEAFSRDAVNRGNKIIVTSRIVGYRESPLDVKDWTLYTLLDFDNKAIEEFANRWCVAFEKSTLGESPEAKAAAEAERRSLLEVIGANPGVAQLASNPLLLTILALVKRQGVTLPNRRVELYELYLKTLITSWSKARALDRRQVGPDMDSLSIIMVLGPLALWLREENPTAGLVSERSLIDWLTECFMGEDWELPRGPAVEKARGFLESVRRYSNLVLERGQGQYGFIHLTFEEMLAAYGIVQKGQLELKESLDIIRKHLTDPSWRETILLAVGTWGLLNKQPRVAGEVIRDMLKTKCTGADAGRNVLIAGACLEDVGKLGLGRAAARDVINAHIIASQDRSLPPPVQRDAGFRLGCTARLPEDLGSYIHIPAGPFLYGGEKKKRMIQRPFEIAKYPVTNLQYGRFLEAGGYDIREFWSKGGWSWRTGEYDTKASKELQKWLARRPPEKRNEPFFWRDSRWNNPLTPVVGVSWFESEAYCTWLARVEKNSKRLPTEGEWERAARHTDGREYPWGNNFDRNRLNSAEFWRGQDEQDGGLFLDDKGYRIASTTMVGQFDGGKSAAGVSDMSGNVWEWTASWYDDKKEHRVLRGGSWLYNRRVARCADRFRFVPDFFLNDVGFRVVSPGFISDS